MCERERERHCDCVCKRKRDSVCACMSVCLHACVIELSTIYKCELLSCLFLSLLFRFNFTEKEHSLALCSSIRTQGVCRGGHSVQILMLSVSSLSGISLTSAKKLELIT